MYLRCFLKLKHAPIKKLQSLAMPRRTAPSICAQLCVCVFVCVWPSHCFIFRGGASSLAMPTRMMPSMCAQLFACGYPTVLISTAALLDGALASRCHEAPRFSQQFEINAPVTSELLFASETIPLFEFPRSVFICGARQRAISFAC